MGPDVWNKGDHRSPVYCRDDYGAAWVGIKGGHIIAFNGIVFYKYLGRSFILF